MLADPELSAVLWHALGSVAAKEGRRECLAAGRRYEIELLVSGSIDRQTLDVHRLAGVLSVGHDGTRASSTGPKAQEVLAHVLGLLNAKTREKVVRELPELFARGGNRLPAPDGDLVAAAENLLGRLRAKVETTVRGAVGCHYSLGLEA